MKTNIGLIVIAAPALATVACRSIAVDSMRSGMVTIWTDARGGSSLRVFVDGSFAGSLDQFFVAGRPRCGDTAGVVVVRTSAAKHRITALDSAGRRWNGDVTVKATHCVLLRLAPPRSEASDNTIVADSTD